MGDIFIEDNLDDLEALYFFEQQKAELEEWLESDEGLRYINSKLMDAVYEDKYEIDCEI